VITERLIQNKRLIHDCVVEEERVDDPRRENEFAVLVGEEILD
jgi:hypothetical protein